MPEAILNSLFYWGAGVASMGFFVATIAATAIIVSGVVLMSIVGFVKSLIKK